MHMALTGTVGEWYAKRPGDTKRDKLLCNANLSFAVRSVPIQECRRCGIRNEAQRQQKEGDTKKAPRQSAPEQAPTARCPLGK